MPKWTSLTHRFRRTTTEPPKDNAQTLPPTQRPALGAVGEKAELVRIHMAHLADRLEDLRTLSTDFTRLSEPLDSFLEAHPQLQAKLIEVEAALRRELDVTQTLRRERDEAVAEAQRAAEQAAQVTSLAARQESQIRDSEAAVAELRLALRDSDSRAEGLERQLAREAERGQSLAEENRTLRAQAHALSQALAKLEQQLDEAHSQGLVLERDNERLQNAAETQATQLAAMTARNEEVERASSETAERLAHLEASLSAEQIRRQKLETQRESEKSTAMVEMAALNLKVDGLGTRLATTSRTLSQVRDQLREKQEALQAAERRLAEAEAETSAAQRRLASVQDETKRRQEAAAELRAANQALEERAEMLTRAVAAKAALLEGATAKAQVLQERVDQLVARTEEERAALEAANRRLASALQSEKAERTLAQGALNIARESRAKLQNEFANLRRRNEVDGEAPPPGSSVREAAPDTNVRPFPAGEATT